MPSRRRKVLNGVLLFACFCSFCVPKIFGSDGCTVGQEQFDCPFGQTCLDKKCGPCDDDQDCHSHNLECTGDGKCVLGSLWPLHLSDYLTTVVIIPICILASSGGLGGGPLFVPTLMLLGGYSTYQAIPLSKAMVLGVTVAGLIANIWKTHPEDCSRTLIDYDAALLLEPSTLIGTLIGVIFNVIFPAWLIVIFLCVALGAISLRTVIKALHFWKKDDSYNPISQRSVTEEVAEDEAIPGSELFIELGPKARIPWKKVGVLVFVWVVIFAIAITKGSKYIETCSIYFWLLSATPLLVLATVVFLVGRYVQSKRGHLPRPRERNLGTFETQVTDISWTPFRIIMFSLSSVFAGLLAGMLGLGAGMIKGPLLLEIGVDPQSTAATSSFMIFFTSASTTMQFYLLGRLKWNYGIYYAIISAVAASVGKYGMNRVVRKYKKTSLIVIAMATLFICGTVALSYLAVVEILAQSKQHALWMFHNYCDTASG